MGIASDDVLIGMKDKVVEVLETNRKSLAARLWKIEETVLMRITPTRCDKPDPVVKRFAAVYVKRIQIAFI